MAGAGRGWYSLPLYRRGGRLGSFTFDDHEGVTWSDCRFDQDELRVEYTGICQYALEVKLKSIR